MENKRILILLALIISLSAGAQQFGGNPPSLRWKQIDTDTARIIFPAGLEQRANDVANLISSLSTLTLHTIGSKIKKIDIVMQPLPTVSNGYVSLGPFRSELFLTPRQNSFELGSLPWHKTLALHEYRHVQQYSNFRRGLSRAFYYIFGQEGQALANALAVPDWFYEGDAVYQETLESDQGRGRLPYFFNDFNSIWASGKKYSWMKLRNGSYRDLTPNHYQLGYLLTAYGYEKYGEDLWKKVAGDAAAFKGLFYPFQRSLKNHTGKSFPAFQNEAINYFASKLNKASSDSASRFAAIHKHFISNEEFPYWTDDSHVIYVKSSYKHIPAFYLRDVTSGNERMIKHKALSNDSYFSYKSNKVVYSAYEPDARWGWKNYEVIRMIDISTGTERKITSKTRYLSPDISADGKKIVAVEAAVEGTSNAVIINVSNGNKIISIPNPHNYVFTYPKFFSDSTIVAAVRNNAGEMALGRFNINTGDAEFLTPFTMNVIAFPQVFQDTVAFSMTEDTNDKLFIAAGGEIFRFDPNISNKTTGNYQLAIHEGRYIWTSFTAVGNQLVAGSGAFSRPEFEKKGENNLYHLHSLVNPVNLITDAPNNHYPVRKYSSSFQLFKFHSWRPYFSDPDYSYSLISQNILNTLQSEIYFNYNRNEKFKETGASISYAGWYPVLSAGGSFTFDRSFSDSARVVNWNEVNGVGRIGIPLSFASGTFYQDVNLSGAFNTKQVYYTGLSKSIFPNKRFNYAEWLITATNQQIKAKQNIFPAFAQTFLARYRHIINNYMAHQLLLSASLYLPGFVKNHNIVLQASYQHRDTLQQYTFTNSFPFSRGYPDVDFPRMWKIGGNYHFPIAYPDAGFANIVYLLRLRGNAFYDYSQVKSLRTGRTFPFKTAGSEIYFDTKWWNQLELSIGFRYSRLLDNDLIGVSPNQYEIVLPTNLLSR